MSKGSKRQSKGSSKSPSKGSVKGQSKRGTVGSTRPSSNTLARSGQEAMPPATSRGGGKVWSAGGALDPVTLSRLRAHVVNLTEGRFSAEGRYTSTAEDVTAIFAEHLQRWARESLPTGEPVRIVLWAHGGLVGEKDGLLGAAHATSWWLRNNVYPISFVWETGLFETIGQMISGPRTRDLADYTSDPILEVTARLAGGRHIWGGMKHSAERAFDRPGSAAARATGGFGGGYFALERLREACAALARSGRRLELHALGHSAGSIFHSHLIPAANEVGVPAFKSLLLLAPAITTEAFKTLLMPHIGSGEQVERTAMFTMRRDLERADRCAVYRKSLLYLVSKAFEERVPTPILGLEEDIRRDGELMSLFGLGSPSARGEIVWSESESDEGTHASQARTHGGFDNDVPTMNSLLRRILGRPTGEILPFPDPEAQGTRSFADGPRGLRGDIAEELEFRGLTPPTPRGKDRPGGVEPKPGGSGAPSGSAAPYINAGAGSGARRALCIGINDYSVRPLAGCVADARLWAHTLGDLGFEVRPLLLDHDATRQTILESMRELIVGASAGDVIAIQYAGHGTNVVDVDGDEGADGRDEALVPIDFDSGAYVIDDDLGALFRMAKPGVNVTCFFDCCHSGTMNRVWPGSEGDDAMIAVRPDERSRFLPQDAGRDAAHRAFRDALVSTRQPSLQLGRQLGQQSGSTTRTRGVHSAAEIFFSACTDLELALEANGHGDFTRHAVEAIRSGIEGLDNDGLLSRINARFGSPRRQNPELHCEAMRRRLPFLQSIGSSSANAERGWFVAQEPHGVRGGPGTMSESERELVVSSLTTLLTRLE